MKKTLAFLTLLFGFMVMFAQSGPTFPYQAVVRNSQNQLIKDSTFAIGVEVYQGVDLKFSETQSVTTNANGQFTMNIGGGTVVSGAMNDVTDWSAAKFKITYHLSEGDIVSENAVSPVPYALQTAFATGGNFLTSDSAVITTMQGNIATNAADITALANRVNTFNTNVCDSVKNCDFSDNASIQNMLQSLSDLISAQGQTITVQGNAIDSLAHLVDSLSNVINNGGNVPGDTPGGDEPTPCEPTSSTHDIEISTSDLPYTFGDTTFLAGTTAGTYTLHSTNAGGCDITITINLSFFNCGTDKVKDVDNNEYNTVKIGNQCWMKENLRTTKKPNSEAITDGMWEPDTNSVETYGLLYSWTTMMNGEFASYATPSGVQGICPTGWHVPSDNEWKQMEMAVGMSQSEADTIGYRGDIAAKLSGNTGWILSNTANAAGNTAVTDRNSTGFSALPAGRYRDNGGYSLFGYYAYFWSATEATIGYARTRLLYCTKAGVSRGNNGADDGYSVRCLRD